MGKTTTVRSIIGLTPTHRGKILLEGREIQHLPSYRIARLGVGLVPEGRQIFPNLSVKENLLATARNPLRFRSNKIPCSLDPRTGLANFSHPGTAPKISREPTFRRGAANALHRSRLDDQSPFTHS